MVPPAAGRSGGHRGLHAPRDADGQVRNRGRGRERSGVCVLAAGRPPDRRVHQRRRRPVEVQHLTRTRMRTLAMVVLLALVAACSQSAPAPTTPSPTDRTGKIGAAAYEIVVPAKWNQTLFLFSHGYVAPGGANGAVAAPFAAARTWLLDHHYAIAGSAYASTGWAIEDALKDQIALLDFFEKRIGKPKGVIAWCGTLGGMRTAGLVQLHPARFAGAMPLCGVLAGGIAT